MTIIEILLIIVAGVSVLLALTSIFTSMILYKKNKNTQQLLSEINQDNSNAVKEIQGNLKQFPSNDSIQFLNDMDSFFERLETNIQKMVFESVNQEISQFSEKLKQETESLTKGLFQDFDKKADKLLDRIIKALDFTLNKVVEEAKKQETTAPEKSYHFEIKEYIVEVLKRVNSGTLRAEDILVRCRKEFNLDIKLENYFNILKELDNERRIYIPSKYLGPDTIIMLTQ